MQLRKIVRSAFICAAMFGLAACGKSPEPAAPSTGTSSVPAGASQAELNRQREEAKREEERAAEKKKRDIANKATADGVSTILGKLESMKTPTLADNQEIAAMIDNEWPYLGTIFSVAISKTIDKYTPKFEGYAPNRLEEHKRLRESVLVWAQQNPSTVDKIVDGALPYLKTKLNLVVAVRGTKGLLSKPYTDREFATFLLCAKSIEANEEAQKLCKKEAEKFGITYTVGTEGRQDSYDENAVWVAEFLNRRSLNGGEKFAQLAQRQLLKLAK